MANPNPSPSTRFQPGQISNPEGHNGVGKRRTLTEILRKALLEPAGGDGKTVGDRFVEAVLVKALKGNSRLACEIWDRSDGKATEHIQISGPDGEPIQVDATVRHQAKDELIEWRAEMRKSLNGRPSDDPSSTPSA